MKLLAKADLPETLVAGLLGGCISFALTLLANGGFDRSEIFTFVGTVAGAAAIVLFSIGQQDRQQRRAAARERKEIATYVSVVRSQIDEYVGTPFDEAKLPVGFILAIPVIINLRGYAMQAAQHAAYLSFSARAHLAAAVQQCDATLYVLRRIVADLDELEGHPDLAAGKRAIVNLHNSFNFVQLP